MKTRFPDVAVLRDAGMRGESRIFQLTHDFRYFSTSGEIIIPAGFLTDGASIPKVFWSILSPFGSYFHAALVHDFLYSKASNWTLSRQRIDEIFLEAMEQLGVGWITRHTIHRAVRMAGWRSFKKSTLQDDYRPL